MGTKGAKPTTGAALRAAAEASLANSQPPEVNGLSNEKIVHELRVHQIELETQNEALRQTQQALEESRDRFVDLYEFAPIGYLSLNPKGMISEINLTGVTLLGRERSKLLHRSLRKLVLDADQDRWLQHFMAVTKQAQKTSIELSMQHGDGTVFQAQLDCVRNKSEVRISFADITQRKLMEKELRIAAAAFSSQSGMLITDLDGVIQRVNPAFTKITGYNAEEVIGKTSAMLHSGRQGQQFYQQMWTELRLTGYWQGELWNRRKNGEIFAEWLTINSIKSDDHAVSYFVGSFNDITAFKDAETKIHQLAYYDSLTQLPNRRLLQDRLDQAIVATARSGVYGALYFIDIDHFKALNDSRGHDVGDLLLVNVAQRLRDAVREKDTVARQGGDEFVVLMEALGATASAAAILAEQLGHKLHLALAAPFYLNGYEYHCKTSIGVGLFHARNTVEELLKHADLALYQAKNFGRDRLRFFDPSMQNALEQRSQLEAELHKAVPQAQLRLYYQPQVDAAQQVVAVEALLRWQHPQRGLVLPDEFIPLAEDTGLILPIGGWVLETACAQIKTWEGDTLASRLQIAVNVSARQFRQSDFVMQIQSVLAASAITPARLKLELTESMLQDDLQDTIYKMHAIKMLGVCFSLDDFGTGYSSLAYLAQLPLDQLKIDKSFVRSIPGVKKDETIVRAIITMGLGLNLNVIAEGVETERQREFLATLGCHEYQGHLFSRPLPLAELEAYLKRA